MPAAERSVSTESTELDKLLALAIGELKAAVDAVSTYAAVLEAHPTETPALTALRDSLAEVRGQTDLLADLFDTELDGATKT